MNKALKTEITKHINNGRTVEDCVSLLLMTHPEDYPTKTDARNVVLEIIESEGLNTKKASKSGALKDWFLQQDDPTSITSEQVKSQCEALEMKGGSVQYYVNSYKLAIELYGKIQSK